MIQVWGGTQDYLVKALQVSQNKAGRLVTGMSWYTPTRLLLNRCGWLSVKQLVAYHTVLTLHKTMKKGSPKYIFDKMSGCRTNNHNTRQIVKFDERFDGRTDRSQSSFCYRGAVLYNRLPMEIRTTGEINSFKRKLKSWIKNNIPAE